MVKKRKFPAGRPMVFFFAVWLAGTGAVCAGNPPGDVHRTAAQTGENSREYPVTVTVERERNLPARLWIYDARERLVPAPGGVALRICPGTCTVNLPAGRYAVVADAGLRNPQARRYLQVGEKSANRLVVKLGRDVWERVYGWQTLNPFFDNSAAETAEKTCRYNSIDSLQNLLAACGLNACGVSNLRDLPLRRPLPVPPGGMSGARFRDVEDGLTLLERTLRATEKSASPCTLLIFWQAVAAGGKAYILEAHPTPGMEIIPPGGKIAPVLAAARDRGALTVWSTSLTAEANPEIAENILNLIAGGLYDAVDISRGGGDYAFWQALLRFGQRIPAVAGGGNVPNISMYWHSAGRESEEIFAALREGRTLVSNGPWVEFTVQEEEPAGEDSSASAPVAPPAAVGEMLAPSLRARTLRAHAVACADNADCIARLELLYNGKIIETARGRHGQRTLDVTWSELVFRDPGWLQIRYVSTAAHLWAVSNPLYVGASSAGRNGAVTTDLRLRLKNPPGGQVRVAEVAAENFGMPLWKRTVAVPGEISARLPATAEITVRAAGIPSARRNLYSLSGAVAACRKLLAAADPRVWQRPEIWARLRNMLVIVENTWEIGRDGE